MFGVVEIIKQNLSGRLPSARTNALRRRHIVADRRLWE